MGRFSASILALLLSALLVVGMVACGSGDSADLLPGSTASEITSNLDQVKELATAGDCAGAESAALAVSTQIEALGGVDERLKQALREGAARLNEVVADCEEAPEEETEPAIEEAIEPEAEDTEKAEKPDKSEKPAEDEEADEAPAETTAPTLPPQAEGKAKGHEKQEEAPAVETGGGTSAGGVGPSTPAEGK